MGLFARILSCVFYAVADCFIFAAYATSELDSALIVSLVRSLVILVCTLSLSVATSGWRPLVKPNRIVWLRGVTGAVTTILGTVAVVEIGIADSAFLIASEGLFMVVMANVLCREKVIPSTYVAILGCVIGVGFICLPGFESGGLLGRAAALGTGFFVGLGYSLVRKAKATVSTTTFVVYAAFVSVSIHFVLMLFIPMRLPTSQLCWMLMLGAGITAWLGFFLATMADRLGSTEINSVLGYLSPVLKLVGSVLVFSVVPSQTALIGSSLILVCSIWITMATQRHNVKPA